MIMSFLFVENMPRQREYQQTCSRKFIFWSSRCRLVGPLSAEVFTPTGCHVHVPTCTYPCPWGLNVVGQLALELPFGCDKRSHK